MRGPAATRPGTGPGSGSMSDGEGVAGDGGRRVTGVPAATG